MTDPRITAVAEKLQTCFGPFAKSQAEWVATMLLDAADAAAPEDLRPTLICRTCGLTAIVEPTKDPAP